jgi:SAM-dependent methyltransferase
MGYSAECYDFSEEMLNAAQARRNQLPTELAERLNFAHGDIRSLRLEKKFDCVAALFHVLSYTASNTDLKAAFATAREHMNPGGIFIFDCWYGPSVLTIRPTVRIKRVQNKDVEITRIAEPVLHLNDCVVDVNYTMFVRDKADDSVEQIQETHSMRYLFRPEIDLLAESAGMRLEHSCNWMSNQTPDATTWGVCFVLRTDAS